MSVADSGEYVCRANNNIDALEASIVVSVSPGTGGPSGESRERPRKGWEMLVPVFPGEERLCSQRLRRGGGPGRGLPRKKPGLTSASTTEDLEERLPLGFRTLVSEAGIWVISTSESCPVQWPLATLGLHVSVTKLHWLAAATASSEDSAW